jgi:hypothetical protein
MRNWRNNIKVVLLLVIVSLCLFEFVLHRQSGIFLEFEAALLSVQWMLLGSLPSGAALLFS